MFEEGLSRLTNAAIGMGFNKSEYRKDGERVFNLSKLINIKAGFGKREYTLPYKVLRDIIFCRRIQRGETLPRNKFMRELEKYYEQRG